MQQPLERLIYRSRMAPGLNTTVEIDRIFDIAVRRNRDDGIVGALAFSGETFVQVVEGPQDKIAQLYERLIQDPRHTDIRTLARWPIQSRLFDAWSMARTDLSKLAPRSLRMLVEDGTGAQLTGLLLGLAARHPPTVFGWI